MKKVPQLFRLLLIVVSSLLLAVVVYAESKGTPVGRTLIGEDSVYFSWGAMLLLASILVTSVTAMVQAKNHMANTDIHRSSGVLQKEFARASDCDKRHVEVKDDFRRVHERLDQLDEIKTDIGYIRGKLEGK